MKIEQKTSLKNHSAKRFKSTQSEIMLDKNHVNKKKYKVHTMTVCRKKAKSSLLIKQSFSVILENIPDKNSEGGLSSVY